MTLDMNLVLITSSLFLPTFVTNSIVIVPSMVKALMRQDETT